MALAGHPSSSSCLADSRCPLCPSGRPNVPQPVCPGVRAGGEPAALSESQAAPGQSWADDVPGRRVPCLFRGSPCPAPLAAAAPSGPRIPPAEPEVGALPVPASHPLPASLPDHSCSPQAAAPDVPARHDSSAPPAPPAPAPAAAAEPQVSVGTGPGPRGTGTCPASGVTCPPSLSLPVAPVCSRVPFFSCQPAPEPQRLRGGPRGPPEQPSGADP